MLCMVAWKRAVPSFKNVALPIAQPLQMQCNASTDWMHQLREWRLTLANDQVEMIRHNTEGDQARIAAWQRLGNDVDDVVANAGSKPVVFSNCAGGDVNCRARQV
jgi:hypothetical protein